MFGLTARQQYIIVKYYHDGESIRQISRWLGVSKQAVNTIVVRAKRKLVLQGLPAPKPIGWGSREELRAMGINF